MFRVSCLIWWIWMANQGFVLQIMFLTLFSGCSGPEKSDRYRHVTMQPCTSWEEALFTCKSSRKGRGLSVILNRADYRFVADYMTSNNISITWLGLKRQRFDEFMWLDCSPAPERFAAQRWPDSVNCGFVNTRDDSLDAEHCGKQQGVICEIKDYTQCTLVEYSRILGRCFYKTCTSMTWEVGRAYCRSHGWDLAVLGGEDQATQLIQMIADTWKKKSKCVFYWVGLRREEWVYPNATDDNATHVYWARNEPGLSGDCAVMKKKGEGYEWRAVSCEEERHQSLCYYNKRPLKKVASQGSYTALQSCRTWQTAAMICDSVEEALDLPVITNIEGFKLISQKMNDYKVNFIWLALTKRHLKDFLWLDCTSAPSEFTAQKWSTTTSCAFLNTRDNSLDADTCSSVKGVICEIKDCRECYVMDCTRIDSRCFHKTCTSMTWEAARAYCMLYGWDLVILGSKRDGEELRQNMVTTWKNSPCASFWVGLRREEWIYPKHANLRMTHVFWDHSEPKEAGQCSIMIRTQNGYKWRVADCNDRHQALCVKSRTTYVTSRSPQLSSLPPKSEPTSSWTTYYPPTYTGITKKEQGISNTADNTVFYAIMTAALWILILLLIAMIIYQRRSYVKKIWKMTQQNFQMDEAVRHDQVDDLKLYPEELRRKMDARRQDEPEQDSEPLIEGTSRF